MTAMAERQRVPSTDDTKTKLNKGFASLTVMSLACHGILNTELLAPSPKPAWFDDLSGDLDVTKVLARSWTEDLAPSITSRIPTHVIDYSSTFQGMSEMILSLLKEHPAAKGKDDDTVKEALALIGALVDTIKEIVEDVEQTESDLKKWGHEMQTAHDELLEGTGSIQKAEVDLNKEIDRMNAAIDGLNKKIDTENMVMMGSVTAGAIALVTTISAIALIPETGGWSLIVVGVGAAALVGAVGSGVTMEVLVQLQMGQIVDDNAKISADRAQIVALKALSLSANMAVQYVNLATQALSDVRTMWGLFGGELQGVVDKLNKADEELIAILDAGWVTGAQKEWAMVADFATQLAQQPQPQPETTTITPTVA